MLMSKLESYGLPSRLLDFVFGRRAYSVGNQFSDNIWNTYEHASVL